MVVIYSIYLRLPLEGIFIIDGSLISEDRGH